MLNEGGETRERLELRRQHVEERSGQHIHALNIRCGGVYWRLPARINMRCCIYESLALLALEVLRPCDNITKWTYPAVSRQKLPAASLASLLPPCP